MIPQPEGADQARGNADRALQALASIRPELATVLAELVAAVATEAHKSPRLAHRLSEVLLDGGTRRDTSVAKRARRAPGPWDPFALYTEHGEQALRERLRTLELEQLRDIVAEHGMDTDRLAMKWRDPERVVGRIVDRVVDRAAKGEGFRR